MLGKKMCKTPAGGGDVIGGATTSGAEKKMAKRGVVRVDARRRPYLRRKVKSR